ncbi:MAG: sigma-70 family RNA polymerase sigma factor [Candidatus Limnocylindrales bacterium]
MSRISALKMPRIRPLTAPHRPEVPSAPSVSRLAADDAAALYETFQSRVRGYVAFRVRDSVDVEDLVSEVFHRALSGPAPIDPAARPAWVFRIAHNLVIDHYRRRRPSVLPASIADRADNAPSLPDGLIHAEELRATDAALRRLPGRQRAAVYLRFYEDLPYETVGSVMGVPAVTARSLVHRALKKLATALGEEDPR